MGLSIVMVLFYNNEKAAEMLKSQEESLSEAYYWSIVQQGFYPVYDVMWMNGFARVDEFSYEKKLGDKLIRVDYDIETEVCHKNQYEFDVSDSFYVYQEQVFLQKQKLEDILNCELSILNNQIVIYEKEYEHHAWTTEFPGFIAHAGGALRTENTISHYSNSMEALEQNYNMGHRVFEFDFLVTTDEKLAAAHHWENDTELSSEQWKNLNKSNSGTSTGNEYTRILLDDNLDEMLVNQDVFLVTDTKIFAGTGDECAYPIKIIFDEVIKRDPRLLDRIIPQVYNEAMYESIMNMYDWSSVIYTIYATAASAEEIIDFSKQHDNIKVITMPINDSRFDKDKIERLHSNGKLVYNHTINAYDQFILLQNNGIDGLYTDLLSPADWKVHESVIGKDVRIR